MENLAFQWFDTVGFGCCCLCTGTVDSGRGEREADGSGEGTARGHSVRSEPRPTGGGSHHGVCQSPVLCAYRGRLHDRASDGRDPTHEVRLRTGLHPTTTGKRQLKAAAPMGYADRQRTLNLNI